MDYGRQSIKKYRAGLKGGLQSELGNTLMIQLSRLCDKYVFKAAAYIPEVRAGADETRPVERLKYQSTWLTRFILFAKLV